MGGRDIPQKAKEECEYISLNEYDKDGHNIPANGETCPMPTTNNEAINEDNSRACRD